MKKLITLLAGLVLSIGATMAQDPTIYTDYGKIIKNYNYDEVYKKDSYLDLYLAQNANPAAPFAILVHGGSYMDGDKADLQRLAETLMMDNISSVVINYSLMSKRGFNEFNSPTYNTMLLNIWHAVKYVQTRAIDWNVRADNYTLIGEEAGGHLSLLAGYKYYQNIESIIAIGAPTDLKDLRFLTNMTSSYSNTKNLYSKLVGNVPYTNEHNVPYDYLDASPIYQIKNVPTLLIRAENDVRIPKSQAVNMYGALRNENVPVRLVTIEYADQNLLFDKDYFEEVYSNIVAWIKGTNK